jgi:hypothetical protein
MFMADAVIAGSKYFLRWPDEMTVVIRLAMRSNLLVVSA